MIHKINKRGQLSNFSIFTFIVASVMVVMVFAGWIYINATLKDVFDRVGVINEKNAGKQFYTNMTVASEQIWGVNYQAMQALRMVAIVYILALGCGIMITGFLEKRHPFMFFIYILIALLAVIFSPTISNAYEKILVSGVFGGELTNFTGANYIILNLPMFVLVISIIGGIGLFVNLIRGGNEQSIY